MTGPISFQRSIAARFVQECKPIIAVLARQVPQGLGAVPDAIDRLTPAQGICQRIVNCLRLILTALKKTLCGCCSRRKSPCPNGDQISMGLANFNNPNIRGQVNGIYITTNETNLTGVQQLFSKQPRPSGKTIHIGCASWHNLDIICARRSTYGLIIDFNPKNAQFLNKTIDMVNSCGSRETFKEAMIHYLHSLSGKERELFFHGDQLGLPTNRIEGELSREGSWLQSEEDYFYVKEQIASKGRLIPIIEDITNFESFLKIRKFLDNNHITIDTLYMSNICNFMDTADKKSAFAKSIKQLLSNDTLFINCPRLYREGTSGIIHSNTSHATILRQQLVLGREVLGSCYKMSRLFEGVDSEGSSLEKGRFAPPVAAAISLPNPDR